MAFQAPHDLLPGWFSCYLLNKSAVFLSPLSCVSRAGMFYFAWLAPAPCSGPPPRAFKWPPLTASSPLLWLKSHAPTPINLWPLIGFLFLQGPYCELTLQYLLVCLLALCALACELKSRGTGACNAFLLSGRTMVSSASKDKINISRHLLDRWLNGRLLFSLKGLLLFFF